MREKIKLTFKLSLLAIVIGAIVGIVVSAFALALFWCNAIRGNYQWLIYFLPFAGLIIIAIHKLAGIEKPTGTNKVLSRIHGNTYVKVIMAPLIFVSTLISQLFGASVGREAAALQIGGSLGSFIGKQLKIEEKYSSVIIETGMAAAFSALFGTPIASALFALEIANGRIKNILSIIPCFLSSFIAFTIGKLFCVPYLNVEIATSIPFNQTNFLLVAFLSALSGIACIIFVLSGSLIRKAFAKAFKNAYIKIFVTGLIDIAITLSLGNQTYNGVGSDTINLCLTDPNFKIVWWACLMKILLTNISLGGGFQGGEIVPALFVGATLGNAFSQYFSLDPAFAASIGMIGLFASTTKCPLASLAIAFELFGIANPAYYLIAVVISILTSGTFRIYEEQKVIFSGKRFLKRKD